MGGREEGRREEGGTAGWKGLGAGVRPKRRSVRLRSCSKREVEGIW